MLITLTDLRLRISDLDKEYNEKLQALHVGATVVTIKESTGKEEVMTVPFDFDHGLNNAEKIADNLVLYKSKLLEANNNIVLSHINISIQEALTRLKEKRQLLSRLEYIIHSISEKKSRRNDGGMNGSAYYEIVSLNFDKDKITEYRNNLRSELNTLEIKIEEANNANKVEIE